MKAILTIATVVMLLAVPTGAAAQTKAAAPAVHKVASSVAKTSIPAMPRFRFENFTTANGLPDNHVFSVLVDGDRIWAGTENGLGLYENQQVEDFTTKDGLAHRAVLSLALDKRTGDVWAGTMGGLSRISGGRIDTLHAVEFGTEQRRGVRRVGGRRERVGGDGCGRLQARSAHRAVVALQRAQHADGRDLGLRGCGDADQGVLRGVGQRDSGIRPEDRRSGTSTKIPTARPRWCCSRIRG